MNVHDSCCAFCFGLDAIVNDFVAAPNRFESGPLSSLHGKYMGFKASRVMP